MCQAKLCILFIDQILTIFLNCHSIRHNCNTCMFVCVYVALMRVSVFPLHQRRQCPCSSHQLPACVCACVQVYTCVSHAHGRCLRLRHIAADDLWLFCVAWQHYRVVVTALPSNRDQPAANISNTLVQSYAAPSIFHPRAIGATAMLPDAFWFLVCCCLPN